MSPLHAVIGREYLKAFDQYNAVISHNAEKIRTALYELPGFVNNTPPPQIKRVHFEDVIDYQEKLSGKSREKLVKVLRIACPLVRSTRYPLLHQQPYFIERGIDPTDLQNTVELVSRLFNLPKYRIEDNEAVDRFIHRFQNAYKKA